MLSIEDNGGQYLLGSGDYDPMHPGVPWTTRNGEIGSDCAGAAISFAYRLRRHRPGFNHQPNATVADDLNVDSIVEDADPRRGGHLELGELVTIPAPGILLITPQSIADAFSIAQAEDVVVEAFSQPIETIRERLASSIATSSPGT